VRCSTRAELVADRAWQNVVSALGLMAIAASCYSLLTSLL
jgi:hypothetical protein